MARPSDGDNPPRIGCAARPGRANGRRRAGAGRPDGEDNRLHIAYPIESRGEVHGAIVVDAVAKPGPDLQRILRRLHWGAGWIEGFVWRNRSEEMKSRLDAAATRSRC